MPEPLRRSRRSASIGPRPSRIHAPRTRQVGSTRRSAIAVRSRSHDATTLPRRQTSATSVMSMSNCSTLGRASGAVSASTSCVLRADVGVLQDVQPFGVGGHQPVLDPVVHHLHEVPGAGRAAVEVALLAGGAPPRGRGALAASIPGAMVREDRFEMRDDAVLATDHQAEAALEAEHAAAGADVDVVDALLGQRRGPARSSR